MANHDQNNHQWGDLWNGEDLSIYSRDDLELPSAAGIRSAGPHSPGYSESHSSGDEPEVGPRNLKGVLTSPSISSGHSQTSPEPKGYRAAEAYLRPSPVYVNGDLTSHLFDLKSCTFTMTLMSKKPTASDAPTEVYLPAFHFPEKESAITATGGKWETDTYEIQTAKLQRLRWWHADGEQSIKIEGVKRKPGNTSDRASEGTYLEQCQAGQCLMM